MPRGRKKKDIPEAEVGADKPKRKHVVPGFDEKVGKLSIPTISNKRYGCGCKVITINGLRNKPKCIRHGVI